MFSGRTNTSRASWKDTSRSPGTGLGPPRTRLPHPSFAKAGGGGGRGGARSRLRRKVGRLGGALAGQMGTRGPGRLERPMDALANSAGRGSVSPGPLRGAGSVDAGGPARGRALHGGSRTKFITQGLFLAQAWPLRNCCKRFFGELSFLHSLQPSGALLPEHVLPLAPPDPPSSSAVSPPVQCSWVTSRPSKAATGTEAGEQSSSRSREHAERGT